MMLGQYRVAVGKGTFHEEDDDPMKGGVIMIDPLDVKQMEPHYGSALEAVRALLIHEMGHFMYRKQYAATRPKSADSVHAKMDWCFTREGHAAMFAFRVVKELRARQSSGHVAAPTGTGDLFGALAEAERKGSNMLVLAKNAYASSPRYMDYCRNKVAIPTVQVVGKKQPR